MSRDSAPDHRPPQPSTPDGDPAQPKGRRRSVSRRSIVPVAAAASIALALFVALSCVASQEQLNFVSSIVGSLAWPLVAIGITAAFYGPIKAMVADQKISRIATKNLSIDLIGVDLVAPGDGTGVESHSRAHRLDGDLRRGGRPTRVGYPEPPPGATVEVGRDESGQEELWIWILAEANRALDVDVWTESKPQRKHRLSTWSFSDTGIHLVTVSVKELELYSPGTVSIGITHHPGPDQLFPTTFTGIALSQTSQPVPDS